jgi:hypothetical protein
MGDGCGKQQGTAQGQACQQVHGVLQARHR